MASLHYSTTYILSLFLMLIIPLFSPSLASISTSTPVSPDTICNLTPFPFLCKSLLPHNQFTTVNDCTRISIHHSLETTGNLFASVDAYLGFPYTLPQAAIRALQDCQFLIGLNMDFLSNAIQAIHDSTNTLQSWQAEEIHTLLSAVLTNQQTCSDGLQATSSSIQSALLAPFCNMTMLYSVSLSLFRHENWVLDTNEDQCQRKDIFSDFSFDKVKVRQMVVVSKHGSGNFTTVNDAVAAAPNNADASNGYFLIYVVAGVYEEYVSIGKNKKYLMMIGDGIDKTVITGNRSVVDGWTTFNSATFAVVGEGFVAMNITIRNTAGAAKHQAVALRNGADKSRFYKCSFEGYQDTLYAHSLRQFYRECDVYGTVDFIFGNAAVVLQTCNLFPRLPMQGQFNTITAQGRTDRNQNTGTSIHNCSIIAAPDLRSNDGATKTFLGRPWKEYSRTVVMQSFMGDLVDPAGWAAWSGDFALKTLYYAEFGNRGPGSSTADRVNWAGYRVVNATEAANFTVCNFLGGDEWLPHTGVPYAAGFI